MTPPALTAELLYREPPELDPAALLAHLRRTLPDSRLDGEQIVHAGEPLPLITALVRGREWEHDLSQTWEWPQAADAVAVATVSLSVAEVMGHAHQVGDRVRAFGAVVEALLATTAPVATWWPNSLKLVAPEQARDVRQGLVNVRMFRVEDDASTLMDSLGLHALGLPDLQSRYRELEPGAVAGMLYAAADYLIANGPVIADGDTIPGPEGTQWTCRRAAALVAPERAVLDVAPL